MTSTQLPNTPRVQLWQPTAAVVLFLFDRGAKYAALQGRVARLPFSIQFEYFLNTGIIGSTPVWPWLFWPFATLAYFFLLRSIITNKRPAIHFSLLLIFTGATSNLFDRLLYGGTVDYLIFFNRSAVNLADGLILAGLIGLICLEIKKPNVR